MRASLWCVFPLISLALWGCQEEKRPPGFTLPSGGSPPVTTGVECEPYPEVDSEASCGQETVNLQQRKPTLYFVLDTSGSMAENVASGNTSKLSAARTALRDVVSEIGHQILYGLATFPGPAQTDSRGCEAGEEVFPITQGDAKECVNLPAKGAVYNRFSQKLGALKAQGGTPLSPTLDALSSTLLRQEGQIAVILVTDGAPNCNPEATCDGAECGLTGQFAGTLECTEEFNCCSPDRADIILDPPSFCKDGPSSVEQVAALHEAGIDTYVIGALGDVDFDDVMNELAEAGGQPRDDQRKYYGIKNVDELTSVVRAIGSKLAQSCTLELSDRPQFANTLNVYFDGVVVPSDEVDGWTLDSTSDTVSLHGEACDTWQAGEVVKIEFVSGCETIIR